MEHLRVCDVHVSCLEIKEVKECLDGLGEGLVLGYGKHGVEKLVHVRLEDTLEGGREVSLVMNLADGVPWLIADELRIPLRLSSFVLLHHHKHQA